MVAPSLIAVGVGAEIQHLRGHASCQTPARAPTRKTPGRHSHPRILARREGDLGIGDTLALRGWIDWAADHGVGFIQLLPINENGADESPYSAISSAALDPIYLTLDETRFPGSTRRISQKPATIWEPRCEAGMGGLPGGPPGQAHLVGAGVVEV